MADNEKLLIDDPAQPDGSANRRITEAMVALQRAVAVSQFYPNSNPIMREALESAFGALINVDGDERFRDQGVQVNASGLAIAGEPIGADSPAIGYLARLFSGHRISRFRRSGELTAKGVDGLVSILAMAPDIMMKKGGVASVWARMQHTHIFDFDFATNAKDLAPRRRAQQGWSSDWGSSITAEGQAMRALSNPTLVTRLKILQQRGTRERDLVNLLLRLGSTGDAHSLSGFLARIAKTSQEYMDSQQYRSSFQVATTLYREGRNYQALGHQEVAEKLFGAVREMMDGPFLGWLTQTVASAKDPEEAEIGECLLKLVGEGVVVYAINALSAERSRLGRRRLVSVLVSIGEPSVPYVLRMLEDQRWYVVRNMVSVLGGVADPVLLGALTKLKDDPDVRIQKEVIRAMGKIDTQEAEQNLIPYIEDSDPAVRRMAVESLASRRSEGALALLLKTYNKIALGASDWDVKVAVIDGLGKFPAGKSVEFLGAILSKKVLRKKQRHERIQLAAVLALGQIGDVVAKELLERVLIRHASPDVRMAAGRALAAAERG
jgi:HEAT repeat protein